MAGNGVISAAVCLMLATILQPARAGVVIAYESGVDAYAEALEGLRAGLGSIPLSVVDLRAPGGVDELARLAAARDTRAVIAVGMGALKEVQAHKPAAPVIAAMVLHGPDAEAVAAHVDLDIALSTQLETMKALLPRSSRVGVILNPNNSRYSAGVLEARARREGFTLVWVECDGPNHLLKALASLKGKVDFVLCFPDSDFYNPVTIKPLVLSSLEGRLPLVGFSPAFVRAGAVAGIYPDYREMGHQIAELALRTIKGGERVADEGPVRVRVAVNQRVARLLGLEFRTVSFPMEVLH
jgi:putative tryptophan/tyrosine transport system substrate-binding protein